MVVGFVGDCVVLWCGGGGGWVDWFCWVGGVVCGVLFGDGRYLSGVVSGCVGGSVGVGVGGYCCLDIGCVVGVGDWGDDCSGGCVVVYFYCCEVF